MLLSQTWNENRFDGRFSVGLLGSLLLHGLIILVLIFWRPDSDLPPDDQPLAIAVVEEVAAVAPSADTGKPEPAASAGAKAARPGQESVSAPRHASLSVSDLLQMAVEAHTKSEPLAAAPYKAGPDLALQGGGAGVRSYGAFGNVGLKDFIRAQVERRWQAETTDPAEHWLVSIHLVMSADGAVVKAEVVPDPRHARDERYLDVAQRARNAVLLSSPLHLPPGTPAEMMDMVLDFDTRDAVR